MQAQDYSCQYRTIQLTLNKLTTNYSWW